MLSGTATENLWFFKRGHYKIRKKDNLLLVIGLLTQDVSGSNHEVLDLTR